MFALDWEITIGKYKLGILESVKIVKSVDSLVDTATIKLPGKANQQLLEVNDKVKVGDRVVIKLGYDGDLNPEFEGYITVINCEATGITFSCEDDLYLLREGFGEKKEFKNSDLDIIVNYMLDKVASTSKNSKKFTLSCSTKIKYESYVLGMNTMYDELKKMKDETRSNIFIKDGILNIHPLYKKEYNTIKYDFSINIEKASLEYKEEKDRKYFVEVKGNKRKASISNSKKDDTAITGTAGDPGGEKKIFSVPGVQNQEALNIIAKAELQRLTYTGYSGNFTTWLIPFVQPGDIAEISDQEFEYKKGAYYVSGVTTDFSSNGGARTISIAMRNELSSSLVSEVKSQDYNANTSKIKLPTSGSNSIRK